MQIIRKIFKTKRLEVFVEMLLLICTTYLLIHRLTDFSLSKYAKSIFHDGFLDKSIPVAQQTAGWTVAICLGLKVCYLYRDRLSKARFDHSDTGKFIEVIALFQNTTTDLIKRVHDSRCCCRSKISDRERFSIFAQGIAKNLAEYIANGFKDGNVRRRNLFISLYEHIETEHGPALQHLFHEDPKRYDIHSPLMLINGDKHKDYECVRAIRDDRSLIAILHAAQLRVAGRKRHKTMTHYIGAPVKVAGQLVGFLNLEFHREKYFSNEDELEDFAQNFFLPFQMLTEQAFAKWQLAICVESKCGCNTLTQTAHEQ